LHKNNLLQRRDRRRSLSLIEKIPVSQQFVLVQLGPCLNQPLLDRKSTRLNSSHQIISYAVFCLKKKKKKQMIRSDKCREDTIVAIIYTTRLWQKLHTHSKY